VRRVYPCNLDPLVFININIISTIIIVFLILDILSTVVIKSYIKSEYRDTIMKLRDIKSK